MKLTKRLAITMASLGMAAAMLAGVALPVSTASAASLQHGAGPGGQGGEANLADALGITAAELQTAQQAAYDAAIDQALADGLITQAQADALKEHSAAGGRFGGRELRFFLGAGDTTIDMDALLADALGITPDALADARLEAQDLALAAAVEDGRITQEQADLMKAQNALRQYLSQDAVQEQLQNAYSGVVQQAVQAGAITQEQADAILSNSNGFGMFGRMPGFEGRHGGPRGFGLPGGDGPASGQPQQNGAVLGGINF